MMHSCIAFLENTGSSIATWDLCGMCCMYFSSTTRALEITLRPQYAYRGMKDYILKLFFLYHP